MDGFLFLITNKPGDNGCLPGIKSPGSFYLSAQPALANATLWPYSVGPASLWVEAREGPTWEIHVAVASVTPLPSAMLLPEQPAAAEPPTVLAGFCVDSSRC